MPRVPPVVRRAREEQAFWSLLSLKLYEARGSVGGALRYCDTHDLQLGPVGALRRIHDELEVKRATALAKAEQLGSLCDWGGEGKK